MIQNAIKFVDVRLHPPVVSKIMELRLHTPRTFTEIALEIIIREFAPK